MEVLRLFVLSNFPWLEKDCLDILEYSTDAAASPDAEAGTPDRDVDEWSWMCR
jgi:hypothetical protein